MANLFMMMDSQADDIHRFPFDAGLPAERRVGKESLTGCEFIQMTLEETEKHLING